MIYAGVAMILGGIAMGVVGWYLNMNTPIQQPLPVVGGVIAAVGLTLALLGG